ncbi:MAG: hypothetical protein NTZ74_08400 [Chloroflexi bacterium]|nr:hypothetical protein [Chloroflexota bacterium]
MTQSDKTVRDGVMLVASYHFLLAILCLVGDLAIVTFSIIPNLNGIAATSSVFLPIVGVIVGIFLAIFYSTTASGLIALKNSARMGAVFLALFGTVGGLFILIGAGIPTINSLLPDMISVAGVVLGGLCAYFLLTVLDLAVLAFMFNRHVRSLFYGEPYVPDQMSSSFGNRMRSAFMDDPETGYEGAPVVRQSAVSRAQIKRETPNQRTNTPEELDAPGDLFTEPDPRKK